MKKNMYGKPDKHLQHLEVYFYPERREEAKKFIIDYISADVIPANTSVSETTTQLQVTNAANPHNSAGLTRDVLNNCVSCKSFTIYYHVSDNKIPKEIFVRNTSKIEFAIMMVTAPFIKYTPLPNQIDENNFCQLYSFNKLDNTFNRLTDHIVYKYTNTPDTRMKFFCAYSQNMHLHMCNHRSISVIRKSEFHRNINALKLLPSTKYSRMKLPSPSVMIYSFENDLYFQFPDDDFFQKDKANENYIFCLKKSTEKSFNYIVSNGETIQEALIYGTYVCEQVYLGKRNAADIVRLNAVTNHKGVVLHWSEDSSNKKTAFTSMEYACYRSGQNKRV